MESTLRTKWMWELLSVQRAESHIGPILDLKSTSFKKESFVSTSATSGVAVFTWSRLHYINLKTRLEKSVCVCGGEVGAS